MIPQADERSGAVAAVADGVGVDRAGDPGRTHLRPRSGEHLVAGPPWPHLRQQDVLQPVRVLESLLQALRYLTLARPQDIAHVLCVGVQPQRGDAEVAM